MTGQPDVIIVGAGIAGLTVAIECAELGLECLILDVQLDGAASPASAGLLAPSLGGFTAATARCGYEARDLYPEFIRRLADATRHEVPLLRNGIIQVIEPSGDDAFGERLSAASLEELEPALESSLSAVLHADDGAVDVPRLLAALQCWVATHARIRVVSARVEQVEVIENSVQVRTLSSERFTGSQVVMAAGAWIPQLEGVLPLPIAPVSGQILCLAPNPLRHPVYAHGRYLVPRGEEVLVGATSVESGLEARIEPADTEALLAFAEEMLAGAPLLQATRSFAGIRPVTPDGLPILGPDPHIPQVHYACGYSRNGILLAPWAAQHIAHVIAGGAPEALRPFSSARFAENSNPY